MTANQIIKKIAKAGIDTTNIVKTGKAEIEIWTGDADTSEELMQQVINVVSLGGFRTGFGGWVLRENYEDNGDWNDPASRWHY
jgi:hypothetical protein